MARPMAATPSSFRRWAEMLFAEYLKALSPRTQRALQNDCVESWDECARWYASAAIRKPPHVGVKVFGDVEGLLMREKKLIPYAGGMSILMDDDSRIFPVALSNMPLGLRRAMEILGITDWRDAADQLTRVFKLKNQLGLSDGIVTEIEHRAMLVKKEMV